MRISQGGATRVRDWRESAGLEVLLDLVTGPDGPPPELARAVLEMRESIGVDAARRCAARADAAERAAIAALVERAAALVEDSPAVSAHGAPDGGAGAALTLGVGASAHQAPDGGVGSALGDGAVLDAAYAELWRAVVAGSQNVAYQLALTSLVGALDVHPEVAVVTRPRDAAGIRALGTALVAGDAEAAGTAARRLLEPDTRAFG